MTLHRGNGQSAVAAEGEQFDLNGGHRLRFALVGLAGPGWTAVLSFLMAPSPEFMALVRRVVLSAAFVTETWRPGAVAPHTRRVGAGPLSLHMPSTWEVPDTLELMPADSDDVTLTVTVAEPLAPPRSFDWPKLFGDPFRIVQQVDRPLAPGNDWESEWIVELSAEKTHSDPAGDRGERRKTEAATN